MLEIEKIKASIPVHLRQYIVDQYDTLYTAEDQAVWRYSLRQLKNFLSENAHDCYSEGLDKTGITVNEIPSIDEMCLRLQEFGWSAVPVSGFIPPAAFMELQSLSILPIASAMRSIDHILYTPAPDIVHEAAGHAPILVDESFASYLKSYAQIAKHALIAKHDLDQYDAIRSLSDLKEHPDSTPQEIRTSEETLENINRSMKFTSEAALLGRMNWWTAEYGLIGDLSSPKIYGAGLLSSIGEARECLKENVKKLPLSVQCTEYSYDITEPQPQLFVTPSFKELEKVLEELSETLAFKKGGAFGLKKSIESETVNTVELDSGLQIAGLLSNYLSDKDDQPIYLKFAGPTQLCYEKQELNGHGKAYHKDGFGSPLGPLQNSSIDLANAKKDELSQLGLEVGNDVQLQFASGVLLKGQCCGILNHDKKNVLFSFKSCLVTFNDEVLFDPSWGVFDMAVGSHVASVYAGPADREAYGISETFTQRRVPAKKLTPRRERLCQLYFAIRSLRKKQNMDLQQIEFVASELRKEFPEQWLPRLEILELIDRDWIQNPDLQKTLTDELLKIKSEYPETATVIESGLAISGKIFE